MLLNIQPWLGKGKLDDRALGGCPQHGGYFLVPEGFLQHLEVFPVGALPSNRDLAVMTGHCIGVVRTTGTR